jgi:vacuolar-type H+-ATPase subunit F/Vma7
MSHIGALGASVDVEGFALAGALVFVADEPRRIDTAWRDLPDDLGVLILTPAAAAHLADRLGERPRLLAVVMPG